MEPIAIFGAGGFGRETALMIEQINRAEPTYDLIGFYDDGLKPGTRVDSWPVLGGANELNRVNHSLAVAVAIADPGVREALVAAFANEWLYFPVLAHPQANPGSEVNHFGRGTIITAGCVLTTGIVTGEFVIINLNCTIGHDVKLGSYCSVMPGCHLSGHVQVGAGTLIGTGANILQNLTIGTGCKVGAGSVVTKSIADTKTAVGIPARIIR